MDWIGLFGLAKKNAESCKNNCQECAYVDSCALSENEDDVNSLLNSIQVKPEEMDIETKLVPEIDLTFIDWDKKVILIVDDNKLVNEFLMLDLQLFQTIVDKRAKGINYNSMEKELIELIEANNLTKALYNFDINNYQIISVTTEYAAFAIRRYLDRIKRVDYAILDIVLGGAMNNKETGVRECLNGIDIAGMLNKKFKGREELLIYTGNDMGKYSSEVKQFQELLPNKAPLFDYFMGKDTPLIAKRLVLLGFLHNRPIKSLKFSEN